MKRSDLRLDDLHAVSKIINGDTFVNYEAYQVYAVKHTSGRVVFDHHGAKYWVNQRSLSAVPESIAMDLWDDPDYDILSLAEGQKFIKQARKASEELNADIIEYNNKVDEHNAKLNGMTHKGKTPLRMQKKKWRKSEEISPYRMFMKSKKKKVIKKKKE